MTFALGSLLGGNFRLVGVCRVFGSSCGSVGLYLAFLGGFPVSRYFPGFFALYGVYGRFTALWGGRVRYYLVDLENVPDCLLRLCRNCDSMRSNLVVFYSERLSGRVESVRYTLDGYFRSTRYIKVENGIKNSLDFNLVCYVGMLVGSFRGSLLEIYVISRDRGYFAVRKFLSGLAVPYTLVYKVIGEDCMPFIKTENVVARSGGEISIKAISVVVGRYSLPVKRKIVSKIVKDKNATDFICLWVKNGGILKQDLYQALQRKYGTGGITYYRKLKETMVLKSEVL